MHSGDVRAVFSGSQLSTQVNDVDQSKPVADRCGSSGRFDGVVQEPPALELGTSGPNCGRYISASEAAEYLGISAKTLANARVTGNSPAYTKAFGRIRYQMHDLADYMAARRRCNTSETRPAK